MVYRDPPNFVIDVVSHPELEPIELGEAFEHLNIAFDDRHHDGWINRNIPTARRYCEGWLGMTLAPQTLQLSFGGHSSSTIVPTYWQPPALNPWPDSGSFIELPYGPAHSVESVTFYDPEGILQTMDESLYVFQGGTFASISLASGGSWPSVQARRNAIQIRYPAGYTLPDESPSIYPLPSEYKFRDAAYAWPSIRQSGSHDRGYRRVTADPAGYSELARFVACRTFADGDGMRAGRLRHRVVIEKPVKVISNTGDPVVTWTQVASDVPADIDPVSVREFLAGAVGPLVSQITAKITLRYRGQLDPTMRLKHRREGIYDLYNIAGVLPDAKSGREYQIVPVTRGMNDG